MYVFKITKEQFFNIFPVGSRNIIFQANDGSMEVIAEMGDAVVCDHCNDECFTEEENEAFFTSSVPNVEYKHQIHDTICKSCGIALIERKTV